MVDVVIFVFIELSEQLLMELWSQVSVWLVLLAHMDMCYVAVKMVVNHVNIKKHRAKDLIEKKIKKGKLKVHYPFPACFPFSKIFLQEMYDQQTRQTVFKTHIQNKLLGKKKPQKLLTSTW